MAVANDDEWDDETYARQQENWSASSLKDFKCSELDLDMSAMSALNTWPCLKNGCLRP